MDGSLSEQIETKITLESEQEKFKLFNYEKVADDTYIIKGLKNKYVYKVDIPEGVVAICEEAFVNSKVIEVNLPNTLMEIEAREFKDCKLLKKINIPETLSVISDEAFYNCVLLEVNYNNDNIIFGNDVFVGTLSEKLEKEELERKEKEEYTETFIKKKLFGRYPQTKVTDTCLINSLKNIFDRNEYGYIEYNHQKYHDSTESYSECNRLVDICKTDVNLIFSNYCDSADGIRPVLKLKME